VEHDARNTAMLAMPSGSISPIKCAAAIFVTRGLPASNRRAHDRSAMTRTSAASRGRLVFDVEKLFRTLMRRHAGEIPDGDFQRRPLEVALDDEHQAPKLVEVFLDQGTRPEREASDGQQGSLSPPASLRRRGGAFPRRWL
jgi:hypothetical protein